MFLDGTGTFRRRKKKKKKKMSFEYNFAEQMSLVNSFCWELGIAPEFEETEPPDSTTIHTVFDQARDKIGLPKSSSYDARKIWDSITEYKYRLCVWRGTRTLSASFGAPPSFTRCLRGWQRWICMGPLRSRHVLRGTS
jgi:hypothetical protein